jgi:regulator of nucleoside diphosphate kinase
MQALYSSAPAEKDMSNGVSAATPSVPKPRLIIDERVYPRLLALAERARAQSPELAERLVEEIERADLRPSDEMPRDVVTLGSEVTYAQDDRTETVRIVAPEDVDIDRRQISVLTPVGAALLGLSVGQQISWELPGKRVVVLRVVDVKQPRDAERHRSTS